MMESSVGHKKCPLFSQANNLYKNKKIHPLFNDKKIRFTELKKMSPPVIQGK